MFSGYNLVMTSNKPIVFGGDLPFAGDVPDVGDLPVSPVLSMRYQENADTLAQMTTIGIGGKVANIVSSTTENDFIAGILEADAQGLPLLVLGGGSNILPNDAEFAGVVVRDLRNRIELLEQSPCTGAIVRVSAGTPWDQVVTTAVTQGWLGITGLSGIPGTMGGAAVQNIGAYGQEISKVIASVRTFDRETKTQRTFSSVELDFAYRTSLLKRSIGGEWGYSPRWIVLDVTLQLRLGTLSEPIRYQQLAQSLHVEAGARVPLWEMREAVLGLRRSKGMVLDNADRDTYSLGSFFTNPVLSAEQATNLPPDAPKYGLADAVNLIGAAVPDRSGQIKTSTAWLIANAGFKPGYGLPAAASLSTKHTLALTNRGGATATQILALAAEIRAGVREKYGIDLVPEPIIMG